MDTKLEQAKSIINKNRGEEVLSDGTRKVRRISSGSHMVDKITGGIPLGTFTYFYGNTMSGKTSLALTTIANAQQQGLSCAFLDAEKTYDVGWAKILGVDTDNLLVARYSFGEPLADTLIDLITQRFDLVVVDSIAAICPLEFLKGFSSKGSKQSMTRAPLAQVINPMICTANAKNEVTGVIFINQPRARMGVIGAGGMGLPGGKALAHYSSISLRFWVAERIKNSKEIIGRKITCKVDKNKLGPAENEATFNMLFDSGIDNTYELFQLAIEQGIIKKSGKWHYYGEDKWDGSDKFLEGAGNKWRKEVQVLQNK